MYKAPRETKIFGESLKDVPFILYIKAFRFKIMKHARYSYVHVLMLPTFFLACPEASNDALKIP
jgi:hypothetical protein